jgi:predicted flap endonuclease-1-like 5' DNA nuclease
VPATLAPAAASVPATEAGASDDAVIEVGDDEIVTAEPGQPRQTLPSPSASVLRSRPPAPPSVRPRSPASSQRAWLPPPQHLSSAPPPVGPASSRPSGVDPWVLANRTLELSRANARVADLLEQVAFRDARIAQLEERLERMQRKLDTLEAQPTPAHASAPSQALPSQASPSERWQPNGMQGKPVEPELPVVTQTRAIVGVEQSLSARDADRLDDDDDLDTHEANGSSAETDERESDFGARTVARGTEEDLQQISGIGPRFEAALRKQGITRLSQIAAWSDADVRQVAKALRIPKSRIVKGRWIEVAREVIGTRLASE